MLFEYQWAHAWDIWYVEDFGWSLRGSLSFYNLPFLRICYITDAVEKLTDSPYRKGKPQLPNWGD